MRDRHECQCDQHDCRIEVKCDSIPCVRRYAHICEECEADSACNTEDLNPQRWEGGLY
jgi:hypothetical protein